MAAPCNTAGQPKYNLRSSSDGLKIALQATPAASGQQVHPKRSAFEGLIIAPTTPAESSSGREHLPYDVFINHHGEDTKHRLASSIYKKLATTGLRVFLDKKALELGDFFPEVLEKAMASASLHIAIFSKNYPKSPWCLAELAFMLQTGVTFIPIFYHVEPSTLRWAIEGKGTYADALKEHEMKGRYCSEKLESWKLALHKASLYTGETINNQRDEEKVVTNVVNRVLKELKVVRLDVAQHPVGLDEAEKDFHDNIAQQSAAGPTQIVGIWGMGGAGKTTLAKHVFNKKCSTIKKSSFLFDVREAAMKGRLHEKQKKLLEDLDLKSESANFDKTDEGQGILRRQLRSVSVLIVLDDVDHKDQLDALVPERESLGHGSLIIVTTRELRVLTAWDISARYKMGELNPDHARELFCWHAFGQPSPLVEFQELAQTFINACRGLPLSLKVLGGLLYGESSKIYWQSQLIKLSRLVPQDIKSRLKISYDALDKEEREMFLDVACFFIGWTSSWAIAVWDGSEWNGLHGLQRLVNKCLVELDEDNRIRQHDHLRDLGREIANQQSPYRLWSKQQIIEVQPQQEAIGIRGLADAFGDNCHHRQGKIIINTSQGSRVLQPGSLGLKIFVGNGDFINQECSELSRELVCLCCDRFEHENFPSWLSLKKLRILKIDEAERLDRLWEPDADAPLRLTALVLRNGCQLKNIEGLESLRSLETLSILNCTKLNTLPSLAEATSLKEIEFCGCIKLEKIESLGSLRSLEGLRIYCCTKLNTLPSLAEATSLKEIDLLGCNKLEKIESSASLRSLERLSINSCRELNTLPSLAEATSLKEIVLHRCNKLEKIESLASLRSLERLSIDSCTELNTLPSLAEATSLKEIVLRGCNKLEKIESLATLRSLERLSIYSCTELNTLPSLAEATSLKEIVLDGCNKLEKIESLASLRSLERLSVYSCTELNTLPSLAEATSLKQIDLNGCYKLTKVKNLEGLKSLETLKMGDCPELDEFQTHAELTSLKEFKLIKCHKLKKIDGLENLRSLETLDIQDCSALDTLPSLVELTSLKKFELRKCGKLKKVEGLEILQSLETLSMDDCSKLDSLRTLAKLTSLKEIELKNCSKLEEIGSFKSLGSLEILKIHDCPVLDGLPILGELISLETFELKWCPKLEKVEGLESLTTLKTLRINVCPKLDNLPSLAELTSLEEFELIMCDKLEKIEGLESLRSLKKLKIDYCTELNILPNLIQLTFLKKIELKNCNKLEKMESLKSLKSLEMLRIRDCSALDTLPSLAELISLEEFQLKNCSKLKKIEGLESLKSLETLSIKDCSALDTLPSLAELTSLGKLKLKKCNNLKKIEGLESLKSLETLNIEDCSALDTLPSLAELTSLKEFQFKKMQQIEEDRRFRTIDITREVGST